MGGLWDYDDDDDLQEEGAKWSDHDSEPEVCSEDEDRVQTRKRGRAKATKREPVKPRTQIPTICLDLAGTQPSQKSDSDDDIEIVAVKRPHLEESAASAPQQAKPQPVTANLEQFDPATIKAIEAQNQLNKMLQDLENDIIDDEEPSQPDTAFRIDAYRLPKLNLAPAAPPPVETASAMGDMEADQLAEEAAKAAADENKITLTCKTKHGELKVRMRTTDPFSKLLDTFKIGAVKKGWDVPEGARFRMEFDGDKLEMADNPAGVGIEDEETIDVTWKL